MAMNTVHSFSEDGKMKYSGEGGNEWLLMPQDKGDGEHLELLVKCAARTTSCRLLIYSLASLLNDYPVFSTQIPWHCTRMNQSVVSKTLLHAPYQCYSNGTLSTREIWPIHSHP